MIDYSEYIIVDALGNKMGNLAKVSKVYYTATDGVRYKRAYSTKIGYEIVKRSIFEGLPKNITG